MKINEYSYGANYYPVVEKQENWERDLLVMKEAGVNFVRTAEIVNSWDRLQPNEQEFDFDIMDDFFQLCEKLEIKVLLGTGSATPPYWVHQKDSSINIMDQRGRRFPNNATYGWVCYNNPTFQKSHRFYLENLVKRYRYSTALLGYQINNEIGYPFMPLDSNGMETYCYCEHCQKKFIKWVKEKYQTLNEVTYAWSWSTTTTVHQEWDDILPPFVKPSSWASVTRWLDWRLFHMDVITEQVKRENELIKELDVIHPTTTNIFYLKSQDLFGVMSGLDQFEVAKHVDIIGYDLYPGSGNKLETRPEFSSMFFDHLRSVAEPLNKEYWLAEAEAGPIGGWVLGPDYPTNEVDILRNQVEAIGHGAKAILYQLFKELPFQALHWGGIINLDGSKSARYESCKKIGAIVHENSFFLKKAKNPKSKVAIFVSKENQIVLNGINQEEFLYNELRGVYQYFWHKNIEVDFITTEHLVSSYAERYSMIYFPFHPVVSSEIEHSIIRLFNSDVSICLSARFGYMDKKGWYNTKVGGEILSNYMNLYITNCVKEEKVGVNFNDLKLKGHHHQETIEVDNSWDVLATFDDETPAVVSRSNNNAKFMYFASHPGNSYLNNNDQSMIVILDEILNQLNIKPKVEFLGDEKLKDFLDFHLIESKDKGWLLITHFVSKNEKLRMKNYKETFSCILPFAVKSISNILNQHEIKYLIDSNETTINLVFEEELFYIIEYERSNV